MNKLNTLDTVTQFMLDTNKCRFYIAAYFIDTRGLTTYLEKQGFNKKGLQKSLEDYLMNYILSSGYTVFNSVEDLRPSTNSFAWTNKEGSLIKANISLLLLRGTMYYVIFDN